MDKDHTPLPFGKYRGKTPEEVAEIDGSYVVWMFENIKPPSFNGSNARELSILVSVF